MYTNNPYAQAGWPNPANRNSVNNESWSSSNPPQPSIFGALPFATPPSPPKFVTFKFTSFNPNILNCAVLGPNNRPYFQVLNDTPTPGITLLQSVDGQGVAIIEWRQAPIIEVRNIIQRKRVAQWIALSHDKTYRMMEARGATYTWVPRDNLICLYTSGTNAPKLLAQISRTENSVVLDIAADAVQAGLLEVSLIATVLLQSGRAID